MMKKCTAKKKSICRFRPAWGRGKEMGRGPYEKSGILRETSIGPLARVHETFEIAYPYEDMEKDGDTRRELLNDELNVSVVPVVRAFW
jgi:hypothetical protein